MKIAICISGDIRTWNETKRSFKEIFCKGIEPDIFVSTYNSSYNQYESNEETKMFTEDDLKNFFNDINVKDIIIENRNEMYNKVYQDSLKFDKINNYYNYIKETGDKESSFVPVGFRIYDQLRKIHQCNELKSKYEENNGFKYDVVIKTRFDALYYITPNWNEMMDGKIHTSFGATGGFPDDVTAAGTSTVMDIYSNRFLELEKMFLSNEILPISGLSSNVYQCCCRNILPACTFCAHGTIAHVLMLHNIELGKYIGLIRLLRSSSKILLPFSGTIDFTEELKPKYDDN